MLRGRPAFVRRIVVLAFTLLPTAIPEAAPLSESQLIPVVVPLTLNAVGRGDVLIMLSGGDVLMRLDDLTAAGLAGELWDEISRRARLWAELARRDPAVVPEFGTSEAIWLSALQPHVEFRFDESTVSLEITARPELLPTAHLGPQTVRPRNVQHVSDPSAFFNYAVGLPGMRDLTVFGEIGSSYRGRLLYSSFSRRADGAFLRGVTNVTFDRPKHLQRWVIGDSVAASHDSLGGGAVLAGVTVTRNFGLDPYFVRQPGLTLRGTALTPSRVDIYVNGVLTAQREVPAGAFELRDFPVTSGAGNVELVVRDVFGREERQSTGYYAASALLARGLSEYTYSIGAVRDDLGTSSFAYSDPALLASHRLGVTDWLTAGARTEASSDMISAGVSGTARTALGEVSGAVAVSQDEGLSGSAAELSYRYVGRRGGFGAAVRTLGDHYANLNTRARMDRAVLDTTAFVTVPVGRGSVGLQWSTSEMRDSGRSDRMALLTNVVVARRVYLYTSAGVVRRGGRVEQEFAIGTTLNIGSGTSAGASFNVSDGRSQAFVDVQRTLPTSSGFGYRLRLNAANPRGSGSSTVEYQNDYGRYGLSYDPFHPSDLPSLQAAGGVVFMRGRALFARPVQDSFALARVPGVEGVRVYAANQLVGRTDAEGDLLLPSLLSYYGNTIRIDDRDIPADFEIPSTEKVIAPTYRGGALVEFVARRIQSVVGSVTVGEGEASSVPEYGQIVITYNGETVVSPLGRGGEFYFENVDPGKYDTLVEWSAGRCRFSLDIPRRDEPMISLGEVRCLKVDTP